jgi:hypothetical protein
MALLTSVPAFLGRHLPAAGGAPVTYSRGDASVVLTAVPGESEHAAADEQGNVTLVRSQDWLVAAADLVLGGETIEPRAGDRIVTAEGQTYEVLPGEGRDCFRASGRPYLRLRIFTKRIAA